MRNFAAHLLLDTAPSWPDSVAARCQGLSLTYAELSRLSLAMGGYLRARGLAPGDSALIVLPDSFAFLASFLGCLLSGIVAAPLTTRFLTGDYAECLADIHPALVIAQPGHDAAVAARAAGVPVLEIDDRSLPKLLDGAAPVAAHTPEVDETCIYFVTSGTTGHPKVVPHTHEHVFAVAASTGAFLGYQKGDVALCSAKMSHAYGLFVSLILPFGAGATSLLDPDKPDPAATLRMIGREKVSILASVPVLYGMMLMCLDGEADLSSLRLCLSAGEALPEAIWSAWREKTGIELCQGYGSTENMTFVIGSHAPDYVPGTTGRVVPPYRAVVLDGEHRPVPPGSPGHLAVAGPSIMTGYVNAPQWTGKAFTRDGLLLTGDMAVEDGGVFTILGRMDDMFKAGGLWVAPGKVESALLTHPSVAQCAVTAGSVAAFTLVKAHIVARPGWSAGPELTRELREHAAALLPDFMVPSEIVFHESLPLTVSGKIQRFKLRHSA